MQDINYDQLVDIKAKEEPFLLEVYQPMCAPCKALAKKLEGIEDDYSVNFYKIDVLENMMLADEFELMSTPAIIYYNGSEYFISSTAREQTVAKIEQLLSQ